jgi:serine/threonine protein kinase/tetratricopeptide (TPR) repeat protein
MAELDEAAVFNAARKIDLAAEREAYLRQACGEDRETYERVATLLHTFETDPGFLESPPAEIGPRFDSAAITEGPGTVIGRYKLLELIGEGGFAVVYMAEQTEPIRRQVALKVIKLGMDTRQVIARFEAERQALALMDHPGIAKVYDAGATETGRPYFVMQLIRGIPMTEFCDGNRLTTEARLRLFLDVCHAVQHAHQKGIIHRDIKPTNVLVALHDGRPVPKVIDFGIAKATHQRLTEKTLYTTYRQIIGTPQYMSPEQAEFSDLDIDTRSDIYSLGVLLYELLTSSTPFKPEDMQRMGYDEICHTIRHSDPPTPSRSLNALGDAAGEAAKNRQMDPAGLRKLLRGDLDWIVMKALEKDRTRRYETADALALDIQRHLTHKPIQARPPSTKYQLQKFVRKHRGPVFAAAAFLALLILALVLAMVGLVRINHERQVATVERDRAEENLRLAQRLIGEVLAPASSQLEIITDNEEVQHIKAEMLQHALQFIELVAEQNPHVPNTRLEMARLCNQLGAMAFWTGGNGKLICRRSISILDELVAESPDNGTYRYELCKAHGHLARLLWTELRWKESLQHSLARLRIAEQLVTENPGESQYQAELIDAHRGTAHVLRYTGKLTDAEDHYREAAQDTEDPSTRPQFAELLMSMNRFTEAKELLEEELRIAEQRNPKSAFDRAYRSYWIAQTLVSYGKVCIYRGRWEDARSHLKRSTDTLKLAHEFQRFPYDFAPSGWAYHYLSETLVQEGRFEQAAQAGRSSLEAWELGGGGIGQLYVAIGHAHLGELLHVQGRTEEARAQFVLAKQQLEELSHALPDELSCQRELILLLANCPDEAFRNPQLAVELAKRVITESNGPLWQHLALSQYRSGAWQEAQESLQKSMQLRGGGDAMDWLLLAMIHWQMDERSQALQWHARAQEAISAGQPILYGDIGVLGCQRLVAEAATTLDGAATQSDTQPASPNPGL